MSDVKFECPQCQQHIECDADYCGAEVSCPSCNSKMIVPQLEGSPPPPAATQACPSCGAALALGSVLCTQCGFNLQTGQKYQQRQSPAPAPPKPGAKRPTPRAAHQGEEPWYRTPLPYVGLFVVVAGTLYFFGRENPGMMIGFLLLVLIYILVSHIIVVVVAFKDEGVVSGLLCLLIPLYAAYYVFFRSERQSLQIIYGVSVVIAIALRFLNPRGS